jgi:serine/threonine-protein kinase
MEGVLALLMPVLIVFTVTYFRFRTRQLEAGNRVDPKKLEAAEKEKKQLEARIQNLESIVCSVDFELNQRLNRLAAEHSTAMRALPPGPAPATAAAGGASAAVNVTPLAAGATLAAQPVEPAYRLGQLAIGQVVLGRYTIERELGRGGMGAVYLARDAKLNERVALKTISSLMSGEPGELIERFRLEVQAARKVTHPNVIRIHDLGEDGELLFLSMEFVEGETLWRRVKRLGPLPIPEARAILGDVAAGVAAAHAAGIVHRDLKPQNVLLGGASVTAGGRVVKVIDFGLAKASFSTGMTATGLILGTPEYMAPEQIRGQRSDARTDVYALGALAYYVLCGRSPFVADTPIAMGFAQVHEQPEPPRSHRPEIPQSVEAAILRALAKDPASRFPDASEWRRAIEG